MSLSRRELDFASARFVEALLALWLPGLCGNVISDDGGDTHRSIGGLWPTPVEEGISEAGAHGLTDGVQCLPDSGRYRKFIGYRTATECGNTNTKHAVPTDAKERERERRTAQKIAGKDSHSQETRSSSGGPL